MWNFRKNRINWRPPSEINVSIKKKWFEPFLPIVATAITMALVIVSICNMNKAQKNSDRVISEMQRATELQWRPYLHLYHIPDAWDIVFLAGDSLANIQGGVILEDIPLDSLEYFSIKGLGYDTRRSVAYINTGATPLRIKRVIVSAMSETEWKNKYSKSIETLVSALAKDSIGIDTLETDIVVLPDSSHTSASSKVIRRRMPIDEFLDYLNHNNTLVLYPFTYIEYEDIFKQHEYNSILIEYAIFPIGINKNRAVVGHAGSRGTEKYRWDVKIK